MRYCPFCKAERLKYNLNRNLWPKPDSHFVCGSTQPYGSDDSFDCIRTETCKTISGLAAGQSTLEINFGISF